ncbi:MAG: isoprenylcysteine carboxylmethyltransferase family protein [Nitrospirota bacterium]
MDRKTRELVTAIILLPGTAAVLIPGILLYYEGGVIPGWGIGGWVVAAGVFFLVAGALIALHTVRAFLVHGDGTPAPWAPPRRLVVRGAYRRVRNPMILSVISILLGEALTLGSIYVFLWGLVFFVLNHLWFVFYEEPRLEGRFGWEYREYRRNVPRWIPRLRPWSGP